MDLQSLVAALFRGFGLVSLAGAIGGLGLELLVIPAGQNELNQLRARLGRWIPTCLGLLLLATFVDLVVQTQAMSRSSFAAAMMLVPQVVRETHFGKILCVRVLVLVFALLLSFARVRALRWVCLLATTVVALTLGLAGHAADWGDWSLNIAVDWTHAVAASAWTGGLFGLVVMFSARASFSRPAFYLIARRFSRLAAACLTLVLLSGIYNAWSQLKPYPGSGPQRMAGCS